MKQTFTFIMLFLGLSGLLHGQVIADFENIPLPAQGWQNNAAPQPYFESGDIQLPNTYFSEFDYWEGWAISAVTNNQTPGFGNQYSAIPGGGAEDTDQYAVGYVAAPTAIRLKNQNKALICDGLYITNNTYAYYSMLDGDAFAKKFGGETGDDPDFFKVTFRKMKDGVIGSDSIIFYLADYRFNNPNQDYIVDEWVWVDLSSLGEADSLLAELTSSDVGSFGMNTPAYICIDEVRTSGSVSSNSPTSDLSSVVWPNPFHGDVFITPSEKGRNWNMTNLAGMRVLEGYLPASHHQITFRDLPAGMYYLHMEEGIRFETHPLIHRP